MPFPTIYYYCVCTSGPPILATVMTVTAGLLFVLLKDE